MTWTATPRCSPRRSPRLLEVSGGNAEETRVGIPVYKGAFGEAEAARLLWRAGLGPAPGQAAQLAGLGLQRAVHSLTRPASTRLAGPAPHDDDGAPLAPRDAWGHDHVGGSTAWCARRRRWSSG